MRPAFDLLSTLANDALDADRVLDPTPLDAAARERIEGMVNNIDNLEEGLLNGLDGLGSLLSTAGMAGEISAETVASSGWLLSTVAELLLAANAIKSNATYRLSMADKAEPPPSRRGGSKS